MLLILKEYFRNSPTKLRLVDSMYRNGISLRDGKFYSGNIEIPLSEIAKANGINRRTVYDTIRMVEGIYEVSMLLSAFRPCTDWGAFSTLLGNQVVHIHPRQGTFSKVFSCFFELVSKYISHIGDISARNVGGSELFIRAIFDRPLPEHVVQRIREMKNVRKVEILTPRVDSDEVVCNRCEVNTCPSRTMTVLTEVEEDQSGRVISPD